MKKLLFTMQGRIPRGQLWLATLVLILVAAICGVVLWGLTQFFPGAVGEDGEMTFRGVAALPYVAIVLGYVVVSAWVGVCVNVKRCHDRGRSGWFMLVQLIPFVGGIWYMLEAMVLRGTVGPNQYGPDPAGAAIDHAAAV